MSQTIGQQIAQYQAIIEQAKAGLENLVKNAGVAVATSQVLPETHADTVQSTRVKAIKMCLRELKMAPEGVEIDLKYIEGALGLRTDAQAQEWVNGHFDQAVAAWTKRNPAGAKVGGRLHTRWISQRERYVKAVVAQPNPTPSANPQPTRTSGKPMVTAHSYKVACLVNGAWEQAEIPSSKTVGIALSKWFEARGRAGMSVGKAFEGKEFGEGARFEDATAIILVGPSTAPTPAPVAIPAKPF